MFNNTLFLLSLFLVISSAWFFSRLGRSALVSWFVLLGLLANLFVLKQIELFHFNATASDIFAIGSLFTLNLLQEFFGKKETQLAIWTSLACCVIFALFSQIHLTYIPSAFDNSQPAYAHILQHAPRIIFASLTTAFLVQQFDSRFYSWLRLRLKQVPMLYISALSILISQFLDTALFTLLGLYGIVSALMQIFLISYAIKCICIVCLPFMATLSKKIFAYESLNS